MDEERAIAVVETQGALLTPAVSLEQWAERRQQFNAWVNTQLREDVDYGKVPGTDKPTLLQPGAQKIAQFYACAVRPIVTYRECNPDIGYLYVEVTCQLLNFQTGQVVGEGIGNCSSYESRYRWRREWWNQSGDPPANQGWEETRGHRWFRRIENRDLLDTWNTVIKMAKKRALVDAALTISGASEKFTQDMDEADDGPREPSHFRTHDAPSSTPTSKTQGTRPSPVRKISTPKPAAEPAKQALASAANQATPLLMDARWPNGFYAHAKGTLKLTGDEIHEACGVSSMREYAGTYEQAIALVEAYAAKREGKTL